MTFWGPLSSRTKITVFHKHEIGGHLPADARKEVLRFYERE
jgi:hypothetical protein